MLDRKDLSSLKRDSRIKLGSSGRRMCVEVDTSRITSPGTSGMSSALKTPLSPVDHGPRLNETLAIP